MIIVGYILLAIMALVGAGIMVTFWLMSGMMDQGRESAWSFAPVPMMIGAALMAIGLGGILLAATVG